MLSPTCFFLFSELLAQQSLQREIQAVAHQFFGTDDSKADPGYYHVETRQKKERRLWSATRKENRKKSTTL